MTPRRGRRTSSRPPACAAAAAPASRWARRRRSCPRATMDKYLVCNADESEPGTFKDRELMHEEPAPADRGHDHRRLRGRREPRVHLHPRRVRAQARHPRRGVAEAEARDARRDILGSDHSLAASSTAAPARTSAARRPALLDSLEGKRGNPRLKPPFPANQGLYQGPTLINNVETLSNVPHIVRMGGEEYAKIGVAELDRHEGRLGLRQRQRPGNYEIELGIPSREIIYGLAGGPPEGREIKCWFPGGSSLAGADRRTTSTSPTTSTRWRRPARCSARARSSSSTTRLRSSTSR